MKIGIDIDGVILDYERVLKTYGDVYDFIELKKDGIVNRNEHYLRKRYNWTEEERMRFFNKYALKLTKQTSLIPGAKDVINMLQEEGHELIVISARGGMIEEMKDAALERFHEEGISFNKYYWKQDDKLEVAQKEEIDVMIDDSYDVCKKLSSNGIARSIYGKIVSSADRETSVENMLKRSFLYQLDKHKNENPSVRKVIEYSYKKLSSKILIFYIETIICKTFIFQIKSKTQFI